MSEDKEILIEKVRELEERSRKDAATFPGGKDNTANVLGERRYLSDKLSAGEAKRTMSAKSRRGFLIGGVTALAGVFGWRWLSDETKQALLRRTFEFNERVSQLFGHTRLAPEFSPDRVTIPARYNGGEGLYSELDPANWRLNVGGIAGRREDLVLTIDDIKRLPRTEMTTEFKCIEGWSTIVHWAGLRFSDLVAACGVSDPRVLPSYVSITTPDEKYFVGWDIQSALHPQTLLAYEMNGQPLEMVHGAPLRLASPLKYGIKQIKRIGRIEFTDTRPRDYWAENGYDWYAGL